jgi:hypothetical protein
MISTGRLKNESAVAYEAWRHYAEMGEERTIEKVAAKLQKSFTIIARWSRVHHWQERIITWQHEDAQRQIDAKAKAALESARLVEKRKQQVHDRAWEMAQKLFEKATAMLNTPLLESQVGADEVHTTPDGKTTTIKRTILTPAGWTFGTAAKIIETSDALARLALGMPQKVHALTDKEGGALPTVAPPMQLVVNVTRDPDDPIRAIITGSGNGERPAAHQRP